MRKYLKHVALAALIPAAPAAAIVNYFLDDGRADLAIGIDAGEDQIWFNTYPVVAGGEVINAMNIGFGRPGIAAPMNGLPVELLLYEDTDGGTPLNATLLRTVKTTVFNANSFTLARYEIPPTVVHGTLLAAVLYRNTTTVNQPIAGLDTGSPTFAGRSWAGWDINLNANDLTSIPAAQMRLTEVAGFPGNFVIRAEGVALPEPTAIAATLAAGAAMMARPVRIRRRCRMSPG